jgi:hypothetical protein
MECAIHYQSHTSIITKHVYDLKDQHNMLQQLILEIYISKTVYN